MRTPLVVLMLAAPAHAEQLRPQAQLDLGLSVIAAGYEHPLATRLALQVEAGLFSTYFLPWFDLGDNVAGGFGGLRATWFARASGHGLYLAPFVRVGYGSGEHEGLEGHAMLVEAGAFVGVGFALTRRLDVRIGGGAQVLHLDDGDGLGVTTPFVAVDLAVGFRL